MRTKPIGREHKNSRHGPQMLRAILNLSNVAARACDKLHASIVSFFQVCSVVILLPSSPRDGWGYLHISTVKGKIFSPEYWIFSLVGKDRNLTQTIQEPVDVFAAQDRVSIFHKQRTRVQDDFLTNTTYKMNLQVLGFSPEQGKTEWIDKTRMNLDDIIFQFRQGQSLQCKQRWPVLVKFRIQPKFLSCSRYKQGRRPQSEENVQFFGRKLKK